MVKKDNYIKEDRNNKRKYAGPLIILLLFLTVVIILRVTGGVQRFQDICANLECLGKWAPLGFIGLYILAVVFAIPGSALTALAGVLFGSLWGFVYVSIASTIGATLAFLIARYLARDFIYEKLSGRPAFIKLDDMSEKYGVWIVAIVRLVPVFPFNLVNYGLGLTRVSLSNYVFFSWLFMLPGTFLYVAGGDAIRRAVSEGAVPWKLIIIVGILAILLYFIARKIKNRLG